MPNTYGVPVAFFGGPNTSPLAVPAALAVAAVAGALELELLALLPELQPAAVSAAAAASEVAASHLYGLNFVLLSGDGDLRGRGRGGRSQAAVSPR
jgi:hypothetical protein